jgi:hypothetical protein
MFIACFSSNMDTILETLMQAPRSRSLIKREFLNGVYSCEARFVADMSATCVISSLSALALALPLYFLVGFSPEPAKMAIFFSTLLLMTIIGAAMGATVGCISRDFEEGRNYLMPVLAPQMIFSGFMLPYESIPGYFKWLYYCSFWQYALGILQINEFSDRHYTNGCLDQVFEQSAYDGVRNHEGAISQLVDELIDNATHNLPPPFNRPANVSLDLPAYTIPGNCTARIWPLISNLWPVRFGGLGGYFLIMLGYLFIFIVTAYMASKAFLSRASRN